MDPGQRIHREKALRRAVLRGDESAWRVLYDAAFPGLYRFAHFRTGHVEARTEEVIQESWMVAVRRIKDFDPGTASFETWLRGIAHNVLCNLQRSWRRDEERVDREDPDLQTVEDSQESIALSEQIGLALTSLPSRYQSVLRARYAEKRTVAEIAGATQQSLKTIESLLSRARAAFREAFTQLERS